MANIIKPEQNMSQMKTGTCTCIHNTPWYAAYLPCHHILLNGCLRYICLFLSPHIYSTLSPRRFGQCMHETPSPWPSQHTVRWVRLRKNYWLKVTKGASRLSSNWNQSLVNERGWSGQFLVPKISVGSTRCKEMNQNFTSQFWGDLYGTAVKYDVGTETCDFF